MSIEVRIPTMMRSDVGGQATVTATGETVGEVLDDLVAQYPALAGRVRADDGSLHRFLNIYLDDEDVRYLDKLDTKVPDNATLSLVPAVAGGSH